MDAEFIRLRVRHFLLQHSGLYRRALAKGQEMPSVLSMSAELAKKTGMTARRLQKYLAERSQVKELSISLEDLEIFAQLAEQSTSTFIAYLLEESLSQPRAHDSDPKALQFIDALHEGHRRRLNSTLFSGKDQLKSEQVIDIAIRLYATDRETLNAIETICRKILGQAN